MIALNHSLNWIMGFGVFILLWSAIFSLFKRIKWWPTLVIFVLVAGVMGINFSIANQLDYKATHPNQNASNKTYRLLYDKDLDTMNGKILFLADSDHYTIKVKGTEAGPVKLQSYPGKINQITVNLKPGETKKIKIKLLRDYSDHQQFQLIDKNGNITRFTIEN